MRKWVRRPVINYDGRGLVAVHGKQLPVRGVWHSTECGDLPGLSELKGVVNFWKNQGAGYGAQILIDKDGNVAMCGNPDEITWAVENHNTGTVSIELVGFARFNSKMWWLRLKQLNKLAKTMAWLELEYGIPLKFDVNMGWSRHLDQSHAFGGTHTDPGTSFPYKYVLNKARQFKKNGWA